MVRVRVNDELCTCVLNLFFCILVRLGNSGLKISRLVMGTMQYGSQDWQPWILSEKDAISHIKAAYVLSQVYQEYKVLIYYFTDMNSVSKHWTRQTYVFIIYRIQNLTIKYT